MIKNYNDEALVQELIEDLINTLDYKDLQYLIEEAMVQKELLEVEAYYTDIKDCGYRKDHCEEVIPCDKCLVLAECESIKEYEWAEMKSFEDILLEIEEELEAGWGIEDCKQLYSELHCLGDCVNCMCTEGDADA